MSSVTDCMQFYRYLRNKYSVEFRSSLDEFRDYDELSEEMIQEIAKEFIIHKYERKTFWDREEDET